MMVNCKTNSTKNFICHQHVLLGQPFPGMFRMHEHVHTALGKADRRFSYSVSQTRPQVHHHPDQSSVFTDLGQEDQQIDFALFGSTLQ